MNLKLTNGISEEYSIGQLRRDITSQEGFPYSVTWFTKP